MIHSKLSQDDYLRVNKMLAVLHHHFKEALTQGLTVRDQPLNPSSLKNTVLEKLCFAPEANMYYFLHCPNLLMFFCSRL